MLREGVYDVRCTILHAHCGDKYRHLQRVVRLQKTMLADILAAAAIAFSVPINAIAASVVPHLRELPPSCLVADPLYVIWRKAIRPPAPYGPSCGLHLYYSPRAPKGGSILKAPPLPDLRPGSAPPHFKDPLRHIRFA
jgi:hypothetical protein